MASLDQFRLNIDAGWLPAWLLLTSIVSTANSISSYRNPSYHQQLYIGSSSNKAPSSPLASRTFGTWTLISAVIRGYAAYNIDNPLIYDLAMWTYGIALAHFTTEVFVYKSAQMKGRMVAPLVVASCALTWMLTQRSYYLS